MSAQRPVLHPALAGRVKALTKRGTVSGSVSHKERHDNEFGTSSTMTVKERRVSITFDGTALPKAKLSVQTYYNIMHLLGQGVSSKVFLAQHKKTGQYVAIKVIPKKVLINNMELAKEIRLLKQINHRYIVKLYDVFLTPEHLQLVMEACEGQELFDEICTRRTFTEEDVKDVVLKILDAVGYLHSMNVAHRDLKPENIMFVVSEDGTKNLKIIDFGFASKMDQPNLLDTPAGTLGYIAPEVLTRHSCTTQADMWSIGVITYIMLVGFPPFLSHADDDDPNTLMNAPFWTLFNERTDMLVDAVKEGRVNWSPTFWEPLASAKEFVSGLLKVNPAERMTAVQALHHPWLMSIRQAETAKATPPHSRQRSLSVSSPAAMDTEKVAPSGDETDTPEQSEEPPQEPDAETSLSVRSASAPASSGVVEASAVSSTRPLPETPSVQPFTTRRPSAPVPLEVPPTTKSSPSMPSPREVDMDEIVSTPSEGEIRSVPASSLPRVVFLDRLRNLQRQATVRAVSLQVPEVQESHLSNIFAENFVPSGVNELDQLAANPEDAENLSVIAAEEDDDDLDTERSSSQPNSPRGRIVSHSRESSSSSVSKNVDTRAPSLDDLKDSVSKSGDFHEWKRTLFKGSTWCAVCDEFIWGVISKQDCKATVHKACKSDMPLHCTGVSRTRRQRANSRSIKKQGSPGSHLSPRKASGSEKDKEIVAAPITSPRRNREKKLMRSKSKDKEKELITHSDKNKAKKDKELAKSEKKRDKK